MAMIALWRIPPENSWGYRSIMAAVEPHQAKQLANPLRFLFVRHRGGPVEPQSLANLVANGVDRVPCVHSSLEDHRNVSPTVLAHLLLAETR